MNLEVKIQHLANEILKHKNLYYRGKAIITDEEYDALERELEQIDPGNRVLQMVGGDHFELNEKIEHKTKMLSLEKTYSIDELINKFPGEDLLSTFKIDGSSCSLIYKNKCFYLGKTRGNGQFGENITDKVIFIDSIPKNLKIETDDEIEVRGEVFCREEKFIQLSHKMHELGLERPSSQRNIVAGILGRKENIELASFLEFQAFDLEISGKSFIFEYDKMMSLKKIGFNIPEISLNKTKDEFNKRIDEAKEFIANGDYLIDGLVFTVNNIALHEELGYTSHHPKYKIAFKFPGESKRTKIEKIIWQVSRNGILTPVAQVAPVELSGAVITRVTLHNFGMVNEFQLKSGDEIELVRSGEVIPKFLGVISSSDALYEFPKTCPSCHSMVRIEDIRLICDNINCREKLIDQILNFVQKIGIDDLSEKRIEEMMDKNLIKDAADLYHLKVEDLLKLEKVKDKLAQKIVKNIEKTKTVEIVTFLTALGINGGAINKCDKIVRAGYNDLGLVLKMTANDLCQIEGFAEKSANEFISSLNDKMGLINKLIDAGLKIKPVVFASEKLKGLSFCITGTLTMKRSDLQKIISDNGGENVNSVTKNTKYLITNDVQSDSSKFKKAKELSIKILTEQDFLNLLEK